MSKTTYFKCPVMVPKRGWFSSKIRFRKCNRKFLTLDQMLRHADRTHGGRGREL
jgi:hypothetical protein